MKTMQRRTLLAALLAFTLAPVVHAALTVGKEYRLVSPAQPTAAPGKIEVVEFFWYGCPHCHKLDPQLDNWLKRQGKDVVLRREHVVWGGKRDEHAKLFYTLRGLNLLERHHAAVFEAIHVQGRELLKEDERNLWLKQRGIDVAQFNAYFKSFGMSAELNRARELGSSYKVTGVPALIVNGKYLTSAAQAGGENQIPAVLDQLVAMEKAQLRTKK